MLLIDQTTHYDKTDTSVLTEGLEFLYKELEPGERLTVHTITASPASSERIFRACYPACPEPANWLEWLWSECNRSSASKALAAFNKQLRAALTPVLEDRAEYPYSAIAGTLAALSRLYDRTELSRVLIFSDMIENSKAIPWRALLAGAPEDLYGKLLLDEQKPLMGAPVYVFGFGRFHDNTRRGLIPRERAALQAFWNHFTAMHGAQALYMDRWLEFPAPDGGTMQAVR